MARAKKQSGYFITLVTRKSPRLMGPARPKDESDEILESLNNFRFTLPSEIEYYNSMLSLHKVVERLV